MAAEHDLYIPEIISEYRAKGWEPRLLSVDSPEVRELIVPTEPGSLTRCMDDRYGVLPDGTRNLDLVPRGLALPGGAKGVIPFFRGGTLRERARSAVACIRGLGYEPAIHGKDGDLDGCYFIFSMLNGDIEGGLGVITREEVRKVISEFNIVYSDVYGPHTATATLLNFVEDMTVLSDGTTLNNDMWGLRRLGVDPLRSARVIERLTRSLLPTANRIVYIVQ